MQILKDLWNNIVAAAFGSIGVAIVHLIIWGDHIRGAATAWFLLFFIVFMAGDIIVWTWRKLRGDTQPRS